ncbi:tubulin-specific chaperone D-like [Tropilaelaps mercedesae]|uniref:Tubulin-specific chaperone D-like n=1 Tax=Tropilaelaps mercedesae TaxID=418985 RepID=A0A1V9XVF5_9ACAR|nr:tubulin-specific chaperone D-like [Tropilaelaps mercedesae]
MCVLEKNDEMPVGLACALDGFVDADYVKDTIRRLGDEDIPLHEGSEFDKIYEKFKYTIDQYQEQPHLLDRELSNIVNMSVGILARSSPTSDRFHGVCRLLSLVVKTRGYKVVRNLFPHEVVDIEKVLGYMEAQKPLDSANWQTHYVLLLWLSTLATVPFALERFDGVGDKPTITERFLDICRTYVRSRLKCNVIAAYMAGCFLSRPDIHGRFMRPYLDWVEAELSVNRKPTEEFVRAAILLSVCSIFKTAKREVLQYHSSAALNIALRCANSEQEFERKLALKLLQRIGLCQLSPSLAPWRYLMKKRGLLGRQPKTDNTENCDETEVPDVIEQIVDSLLTGLGDRVLIVRWSAAKGIGRLASRLPKNFAIEVSDSVFTLFEEKDRESLWQGGCMALAEFGRRGVLLPVHLAKVVSVLLEAFVYDDLRGSCSVGSIVRDTACYVAWTLGRSYEPSIVEPFVNQLAGQLLCLASFDREVNVRRAASAAFQECVGRMGNFPNGIDLVRTADYISVGLRNRAYLHVGVSVAGYKEYTRCVIEHLLYKKVIHWDRTIRDLAALTLKELVHLDPIFFLETGYKDLFEFSTCVDTNMRLGALSALGQVTLALSELKVKLPENVIRSLLNLVLEYKEKCFFSSSMHNQTLGVFSEMICNLAGSHIAAIPPAIFHMWWYVGERCLENPGASIQRQGARALSAMLEHLVEAESDQCTALLKRSCHKLQSDNRVFKCGHALFLGELSSKIIVYHAPTLFKALQSTVQGKGHKFVEAREKSLTSLGNICCILASENKLAREDLRVFLERILSSVEDYSLSDTFFDVGLYARLAAMNVFKDLVIHLYSKGQLEALDSDLSRTILQRIVSHIANAQRASADAATNVFKALLESCPEIVPCTSEVREALVLEDSIDIIGSLLLCDVYRQDLVVQLLMAIGAKTLKECTKAQLATLKYLQGIQDNRESVAAFSTLLARVVELPIFRDNQFLFPSMARGVGRLLNTGALASAPSSPMRSLMDSIWNNVRRTTIINKILSSIELFCEMLQFEEIYSISLQRLTILLLHRHFPQVRSQTASKLYETLLMYSAVVPEENYEVVLALLSNTEWVNDEPEKFEEMKAARNHLCDLLNIPQPKAAAKPT